MMVQATPRAPLKMIEPQFLFQLLVALLNLPPLMGPVPERTDRRVAGSITQIILVPSLAVALNQ
jgi:hypothetical protein